MEVIVLYFNYKKSFFVSIPFTEKNPRKVELGLTGSGLPVKLSFSSGLLVNFMECFLSEQTDILCTLKNECKILPVSFAFHKIPHFNIDPPRGKIKPQAIQVQCILFLFVHTFISIFLEKLSVVYMVPSLLFSQQSFGIG